MNLFMKEGTALPMEMPLILLAPDSEGSTTFFSFSYENARFAYQIAFFSYSLFFLIAGSNFFITSPSKSLAPSGGFSFYTTGFFFASLPPFFFSSYLGSSGLGGSSLLLSMLIDELRFESFFGTEADADAELRLLSALELLILDVLMLEVELLTGGFLKDGSGAFGGGSLRFSLGLFASLMKLLLLSAVVLAESTKLFTFTSLFIAPISPVTICCTILSSTDCESGFFIYILND